MPNEFKRNLTRGFGLSVFLLVASSVAAYVSISLLIGSSEMVDHTNRVIQKSESILSNIRDAETGQRGFLLTKQADFLGPYNGAYQRTVMALKEVRDLTVDNASQQGRLDTLEILIGKRFSILEQTIANARQGIETSVFLFRDGQKYMEDVRLHVSQVQNEERRLLKLRTDNQEQFSRITPIVIIVASVLAIAITLFFFRKILKDFEEKNNLSIQLDRKDREITERIAVIQRIAGDIAQGDYSIRVDSQESDALGSLGESLNRMAVSLDQSFTRISAREWLQKGAAQMSERIAGEKDIPQLSKDIIDFVTTYTSSDLGALYLVNKEQQLYVASAFALAPGLREQRFKPGEGLAGECFSTRSTMVITDIPETSYTSAAAGSLKPAQLVLIPLKFEGIVLGVLELGKLKSYTPEELEFLNSISEQSGLSINTSYNRTRVKELLEETQAQSEELQQQHRELENMNAELEVQAEKLQTSEEELKVQQEELLETNQELEERSRALEEKNHLVVVRNLEIQKKAEELAVSTRYKSEFLANMSHELRTPLNSVLLLSRLLYDNTSGNLTTEQVEFARVIQSSGHGLLELIDEILDLSKIESGKLDLEYEKVKISDITENMQNLFVTMAREKKLEFVVKVAENVPQIIDTDRMRLEQIIKNFISNALKFTATGSITLDVSVPANDDSRVQFAVRDTGIGIPAEKHALIFEAFQQADGSTKRKYGGTGLGLSISRQLAHLLSGSINLESDGEHGSTFLVTVPVFNPGRKNDPLSPAQMRSTADIILPSPSPVPARMEFIAPAPSGLVDDDRDAIGHQDKVILVVEDDRGFALALLDFARKKGYKAVVVGQGDLVMEAIQKWHPIGILLDIQLPGKDGLTVMEELKQDPRTRGIPVHMMSSFEARKESLERGAVDFINKPISPEQMDNVLERIERAMGSSTQKVLVVEDNNQHAKALEYFLQQSGVKVVIAGNMDDCMTNLKDAAFNCVILDMGSNSVKEYEELGRLRLDPATEPVPVIIFTGKSLSRPEEKRIRQYADSIIVKTAHSYQRILNEISLFLHLVDLEDPAKPKRNRKLGTQDEVLQGKTVLVADDDVRNIFSLTKALEALQMKVIPAMDGKEALQLLESNAGVDIVLMDMMMPELDGYEAISRIRRNNTWKRLPVIAVTAKAAGGDRDKCIQAGASDYISKPVDTDQLISLMRIWLYDNQK